MTVGTMLSELTLSRVQQDWVGERAAFDAQPPMTRVFLDQQARRTAEKLLEPPRQINFLLPDRILLPGDSEPLAVPPHRRHQSTGRWLLRASAEQACQALIHLLDALEHDPDPALMFAGSAMRYAIASTMIHEMLPDGLPVVYVAEDGDEIPSVPLNDGRKPGSALMAATDAIVETEAGSDGRVQVPFSPAARRFFLPQWVVLDEDDHLLVNQPAEAESCLASMQRYVQVLKNAIAIAPYMVADETYQRKRAGMLGQLVNQGRALARFYTRGIIDRITQRAQENSLNRGLNVSIPYFDDQRLAMQIYEMSVIPAGRIVFLPAFVVRAVRLEAAGVAQSASLNSSTRHHLLAELAMLEAAFIRKSPSK
jgi:hypothetical protein